MSWGMSLVLARASHMAYSYARSMFWNHENLPTSCMLRIGLWMPDLATLMFPLLSCGIKDTSRWIYFVGDCIWGWGRGLCL